MTHPCLALLAVDDRLGPDDVAHQTKRGPDIHSVSEDREGPQPLWRIEKVLISRET